MPKAKHKQETEFTTSPVKSAFLYGKPNKNKLIALQKIQKDYTDAVNLFIQLLNGNNALTLQIIKNDKKDSDVRKFEKVHRYKALGSALGQNAFDDAFTMLSNRMNDIRNEMCRYTNDIFVQSKVLFAMSVMGNTKSDMIAAVNDIIDAKITNATDPNKVDVSFYNELISHLQTMSDETFSFRMMEFIDQYTDASLLYHIPAPKKMSVRLDSRLHTLEKATTTQTTHVISVTDPAARGIRISVPLNTSSRSVSRLERYKTASSVLYSITDDMQMKVTVSFEKKVSRPETNNINGVDTGITDCFYVSDGSHYGSMSPVIKYYKDVVEPSLAGNSDLRNKKKKIKHYLKTHKDIPDEEKRFLVKKMDLLEDMVRKANAPREKLRSYNHMVTREIASAVKQYVDSIPDDTLTVIERLDIKEFNQSRRENGMRAVFTRGQLQKKLMEQLNWVGKAYAEVDPDFTSQLCPVCSNVDPANRNGSDFKCTCCGYEGNADHTAGINIRDRQTDTVIQDICVKMRYQPKKKQKAMKEEYASRNAKWRQNLKDHGDTETCREAA